MYQFSYADVQTDSMVDARERERQLLDRSIEMLQDAKGTGATSRPTIEAAHFTMRLWTTFIEDLGTSDNSLPKELRANLISIGIWVVRTLEDIRAGRSEDYDGVIEISRIIRDGIQ
ncbi:flagellar biosynthesis regulator FlaF [Limoniibacter endophyticus]|uniref:flagellar biosynthesis regulator FlaF n=1 Tax=Limoniibacter endophyticus TaxID=1565040 RepID=UPI001675FA49|nr:flagellar biosynthesis regulator FlaF [Limoniibacter endophyticus]